MENLNSFMTNYRIHKSLWTSQELEIVYKYVYGYFEKISTLKQLCTLLPNRSFCAVKNKVKKVKFG